MSDLQMLTGGGGNSLLLRRRMMGTMRHGRLPLGYSERSWVQGNGSAIDLGIIGSQDLDFEIKLVSTRLHTSSGGIGTIFGSRLRFDGRVYQLSTYNKEREFDSTKLGTFAFYNIGVNKAAIPTAGLEMGYTQTIKKSGSIFVSGIGDSFILPSTAFTTPGSLYLFANHQNTVVEEFNRSVQVHEFLFSKNGAKLAHLVPATRDLDGVNGIYDLIRDVFLFGDEPSGIICGDD